MSWTAIGLKVARVGFKSKGFGSYGDEDPHAIIADAMNPKIPADEVLARARIRSKSGKLLEKVTKLIAQRDTGALDVVAQIGNSIL
jgi:hypothetical protein